MYWVVCSKGIVHRVRFDSARIAQSWANGLNHWAQELGVRDRYWVEGRRPGVRGIASGVILPARAA